MTGQWVMHGHAHSLDGQGSQIESKQLPEPWAYKINWGWNYVWKVNCWESMSTKVASNSDLESAIGT